MTTSHQPCPDCGATTTHAEAITDLTAQQAVQITVYRCPDCGKSWQVVKHPAKKA